MRLSFVVPGPPQPKERPRRGKGGRFYTPDATRGYEHALKTYALQAARLQGWPLATRERLAVTLRAFFPDRRTRDLDNTFKCLDGANGVVWHDDEQIDELHVYRGVDRKNPRLEVTVEKVVDGPERLSHRPGGCHETKQ
jgi:crossover junction endodeoxyribonuclease RusA